MKVVFKGLIETKTGGGCASCGKRAKSGNRFVTSKSYFLPSGDNKTFVMDKPVEVSERDGQFLLSYIEKTKDGIRKVFEKA